MAEWLVVAMVAYALAGALFALAFVVAGVSRIDPTAKGSTLGFRIVIFPAAAALWPLLLHRWTTGCSEAPFERNRHRDPHRKEIDR